MRKVRNQKGFTIMELMIVIVIIGILIAIAVPAYQNFRTRAVLTACQSNMRTIKSAWGLYIADGGADVAIANAGLAAALGAHMGTVPQCPGTGAAHGVYSIAVGGIVNCTIHGNV